MNTALETVTRSGLPADLPSAEREHFDHLARKSGSIWWGSTTFAGRRRLARRARMLAAVLRELGEARVLEVGCGTGALTEQLVQLEPRLHLTACDISSESIAVARQQCRNTEHLHFEVVDVLSDPYADDSFDAIIGNSVLHHLHVEPFLPLLARMVRPGGVIFFFEPNMLNPQVALERNVRFIGRWLENSANETAFVRWGLHRALERAGFAGVSVTPFDFLHPAVPGLLVNLVEPLAELVEKVPVVREIAGSLIIRAHKPNRISRPYSTHGE